MTYTITGLMAFAAGFFVGRQPRVKSFYVYINGNDYPHRTMWGQTHEDALRRARQTYGPDTYIIERVKDMPGCARTHPAGHPRRSDR